MGVTININGLSLVHKGSGGTAMATVPDVCKTPSPGGPVPVPYPNIARSASLAKGSTTVKVDGGNSAANKGSEFATSSGDEAGTLGGVKSGVNMKEATWLTYSIDVKIEGKNAARLTDKMLMNHGNTVCLGGVVNPPLSTEDEALINCILELCARDPEVVAKAKRLTLISRKPKKVDVFRYTNGKWEKKVATSLGSARGRTIWLNRGMDCEQLKDTIYHEVRHTDQPANMSPPEREMDAYTATERWMIDRGMSGHPAFRRVDSAGRTVVDTDGIRAHVQRMYGYNIPDGGALPPQVTGRTGDGRSVTLSDGTSRPVREGDSFKQVPDQNLQERTIPPARLTCP